MSQKTHVYKLMIYRYGIAIVIALLAFLLTAILWDITQNEPFILLLGAVVISSWLGGLVPGVLCAFLSIMLVDYFLILPRYEILTTPSSILQFLLFGFVSTMISWLEEGRNRSERVVYQYKEELEVILNSMNEGVVVQDETGQVVFANTASSSQIGRASINAIVGVPDSQFEEKYKLLNDHEATMVHVVTLGNRVFSTARPAELMFGVKARDTNQETWFTLKSVPIFDESDKIRLVVNTLHDITEKRRVDKIRIQSAERLRKVIDNLSAFVGVLSPTGIVLEMNTSALHAANLEFADVIGKPLEHTHWWAYDEAVQAKLRDAIHRSAQGETVRYDVRVRLANNRFITLDFILAPVLDADGKVEFLIPSGIDVTTRNNLTNQLLIQQHRQATIISNVPGIVFEGSAKDDGVITTDFISPYIEKMLGYSIDEWRNDPLFWKKRILPEDWDTTVQEVTAIYQGGEPKSSQFRCFAKDGRIVSIESHIGFLRNAKNEVFGTVGVMMDVTERRRNEEELAHYTEEMRRSNEELEQFAYVASHDLQEPLRMVTSYLQLIEQRYGNQLDSDGKEFIAYAVDGAARMKTLINDLLVYSRIQRNREEFEPVELTDSLEQALHNLQLSIEDTHSLITHDPLPKISANRVQMVQLLQNLIGNALKFKGERIPEIHIGAKRERELWHFTVSDNGIGIDSDYLERIFIIFQRLHGRNEYAGTGIGLAICKKIVDKHGGQIYAQSTLGEGTTFHFTIPIKQGGRRLTHGTHPDITG